MKKYSVPVVLGIGITSIITILVILVVSLFSKQKAINTRRENIDLVFNSETVSEEIIENESDFNIIVTENSLIEEKQLYSEVSEEDEFCSLNIDLFNSENRAYNETSFSRINELCGFIKYGSNVEENYNLLIEELPSYLYKSKYLADIPNNDKISIISRPLNDVMTITFLTSKISPETRVYITQTGKETDVYTVCVLKNMQYINFDILESRYIIIHTSSFDYKQNALILVGKKNGVPKLLSYYKTNEFISLRAPQDISIGSSVYVASVEKEKLLLYGEKVETKVGVLYNE